MRRLYTFWFPVALLAAPDAATLEREWTRMAPQAGGVVGVAALHLETGRRVSLRGGERFPMASTYKVPIAVQLLGRVERGGISLDQMVPLAARDLHPGSGTLTDLFHKPGLALSVRNLLELMLLISDNSATDVLLQMAGGPEAVTQRMRALGIEGLQVSRPTALLIADWRGIEKLPPEPEWTPERFDKLSREVAPEARHAAAQRFDADPRDTSTPDAMVDLLARIHSGAALGSQMTDLLLDIMRRCRTGEGRLKGMLPPGVEVAHKTGGIGGTTNDAGILRLPGNAGHVAVAAFVKSSDREAPQRERAIAQMARAAYDYFLFTTTPPDYDALAARIVAALKLRSGERVLVGADPGGYFHGLLPPLRRRLGDRLVQSLDQADVYLWLPRRSDPDRQALSRWTDQGGSRRQIHFHWDGGSVRADGLRGDHSPGLDAIYQAALDIDYAALSAAQDRAIQWLRSGLVRVRTPDGTDLRFRVGERPFNKQDGDASPERAQAAKVRVDREIELPAGVLRVAPLEETVTGRIVVPEARFGEQVARGITFEIRKGRVTRINARESQAAVQVAPQFREFALGFNPKLPGLAYFGYGTGAVRLSFGDNEELGGAVRGGAVRWFFFPNATVEVDGRHPSPMVPVR
jgi:beta-lactamase class A